MRISVSTVISLLLLLLALVMYIGWSISYNDWGDIGIYSTSIFFGLLGILIFLLSLFQKE